VEEANAIGTTYLRSQLLPTSMRGEAQVLLRRYVELRVHSGKISLDEEAQRDVIIGQTNKVLDDLWGYARRAAEEDGRAMTAGLFIQSLNELIDSYGRRDAALRRHVPELVLFLLYGTFLLTGGVVGYAAGVAGHRPSFATYILIVLIVVLTFIIVDLDRPRRGLITVSQTSLVDLASAIDSAQSPGNHDSENASRPAVTGRR
jgi:CHASE2 domain-containing sensor protein